MRRKVRLYGSYAIFYLKFLKNSTKKTLTEEDGLIYYEKMPSCGSVL